MGRKKGGHNKSKVISDEKSIPLDIRDIKSQIRVLRKIKKNTRKATPERRELSKKIRELKKQLQPIIQETCDPEKQKIIDEIIVYHKQHDPYMLDIKVNYYQYTIEQLQKHLNKKKQNDASI